MREGIFVKTAMTADINRISLGARDVLLNNGIEFFIHQYPYPSRNVSPLSEPECLFLGRRLRTQALLVWNGEHYNLGNALGIVFSKNVNFMTENYFGKEGPGTPMETLHKTFRKAWKNNMKTADTPMTFT